MNQSRVVRVYSWSVSGGGSAQSAIQALESAGLTPTYMGTEVDQQPYSAEALRASGTAFVAVRGPGWDAAFVPATSVRMGTWTVDGDESTVSPEQWSQVLDSWATTARAVLGFVHVRSGEAEAGEDAKHYDRLHRLTGDELRLQGLRGLYARTWLGPELVERIGRARLSDDSQLITRTYSGGAMRVDLADSFWDEPIEELASLSAAVRRRYRDSGAFSIPLDSWSRKAHDAWQPLVRPGTGEPALA